MDAPLGFKEVVAELAAFYGLPEPPVSADPFALILWENAAYLVDDARRTVAFDALRGLTELTPEGVLNAPEKALLAACRLGGMMPEARMEQLRRIAGIAIEEFDGDLLSACRLSLKQARKAMQRFPSIGEPGAEKILLFSGSHPVLGLESNGLRVLLRLGYGRDDANYGRAYRSVQEAIAPELPHDIPWLIAAHQLLRRHGQETCRRSAPLCSSCPLANGCPSADRGATARGR